MRRIVSATMALHFAAFGAVSICARGAENAVSGTMNTDYYSIEPFDDGLLSFSEYYEKYSGEKRPEKEIILNKNDISAVESGDITIGSFTSDDGEIRNNVILWKSADGSIAFELNVQETGNYCILADYCPMLSGSPDIELEMEIDGKLPYDTASRMTLGRVWTQPRIFASVP